MKKKDILCRLDDSYSEAMLGTTEEIGYEFFVPYEYEYVTAEEFDKDDEEEEVTVASLWENIRKKKEREGKNYRPAKPGEKDRPDPKAWKKAQSRKMTRSQINDLPDSDFAYIEPGGSKDEDGKTTPRSLRHLPIHDAAHVRNALARLPLTKISPEAKKQAMEKIMRQAKKFKVEVSDKSKASMAEYFFTNKQDAIDMAKKIGIDSIFTHTTLEGVTYYIPGTCIEDFEEWYENEEEISEELNEEAMAAEYQGRKVTLNKPFRTSNGPKKFAVYTKNESGNVVIVRFGDPNMRIRKSDPERRKAFRARHNCSSPGPKWKSKYWSCQWSW